MQKLETPEAYLEGPPFPRPDNYSTRPPSVAGPLPVEVRYREAFRSAKGTIILRDIISGERPEFGEVRRDGYTPVETRVVWEIGDSPRMIKR